MININTVLYFYNVNYTWLYLTETYINASVILWIVIKGFLLKQSKLSNYSNSMCTINF